MLGRTYEREHCSAARALEVVGERWSLLIIRNAMFAGATRFTEFQRMLGVAPNILASRLERFVAEGIMRTRPIAGDDAHEYVLTDKGRELQPVIIALTEWGDRYAAPEGPPVFYLHEHCGGAVRQRTMCEKCHGALAPAEVTPLFGPGHPAFEG